MDRLAARPTLAAALILGLALIVRLTYITAIVGLNSPPTYDGIGYDLLAVHLLKTGAYGVERPTAFRPPGYPLFLAGIYALFGHSYPAVRLIQALLDSITCLLVFLIGRELFNRRVGLLAALELSLYPLQVYMVGEFYSETVSFLLQGIALWLAARMVRQREWAYPLLIGLFAAATALTRPTATLWVPLMAGWAVLFPRRWKERWRNLALVALGLLLLFGPWTWRNYRVFRAFIPVASLGGVGVWAGNNPLSQGGGMLPDERTWGEGAPEWGWMGWANLSEVESSQRFLERGLQWIQENPLDFALLVPKKLLRLWSPTSFGVQFSRRASPTLTAVVLPPYLVFLGVAFAGMYRTRRGWWEQFPLYSVILGVNALVVLTYGATRYGIAFASVLCLYAAAALLRLREE
ncbi:MAG: glycosyltransferase family 39 protein [Anaerolineae bacterium]|nr:glycosyltransferase family 39 protein [Anaerolineae bacterium]